MHFYFIPMHAIPRLLSCQICLKVNYVSVSSLFCCLTPSNKLNIHSGCPPRNLTSNSKDFRESIRKLRGIIFLYFGRLLTCSRYLFSFLMASSHSPVLLWTVWQIIFVTRVSGWDDTWHWLNQAAYIMLFHIWTVVIGVNWKQNVLLLLSGCLPKLWQDITV